MKRFPPLSICQLTMHTIPGRFLGIFQTPVKQGKTQPLVGFVSSNVKTPLANNSSGVTTIMTGRHTIKGFSVCNAILKFNIHASHSNYIPYIFLFSNPCIQCFWEQSCNADAHFIITILIPVMTGIVANVSFTCIVVHTRTTVWVVSDFLLAWAPYYLKEV